MKKKDTFDELSKINQLFCEGIITEEEFATQKAQLFDQSQQQPEKKRSKIIGIFTGII